MNKYNIGFISTSLCLAQQERLLKEGHFLHVMVAGYYNCTKPFIDESNLSIIYPNYTFANSDTIYGTLDDYLPDLNKLKETCDFIVMDYNGKWLLPVAEYLRDLGAKVIGPTSFTDDLEYNRDFGKLIANKLGIPSEANKGQYFNSSSQYAALEYLDNSKATHVLKGEKVTILPSYFEDCKDILENDPFGYFVEQGSGVYLERKIEGLEIAFGSWFNGSDFAPFYFVNKEFKGSHDKDMSGVLTGESGSIGKMVPYKKLPAIIQNVFDKLRHYLASFNYRGYIDLNTIYQVKENRLNFLEWTTRFGYPTENQLCTYMSQKNMYGQFLFDLANDSTHLSDYKFIFNKPFLTSVALISQYSDLPDTHALNKYKPRIHVANSSYLSDYKDSTLSPNFDTYTLMCTKYNENGQPVVEDLDRALFINYIHNDWQLCDREVKLHASSLYCYGHYYRTDITHKHDFNSKGKSYLDYVVKKMRKLELNNTSDTTGNVSVSSSEINIKTLGYSVGILDNINVLSYIDIVCGTTYPVPMELVYSVQDFEDDERQNIILIEYKDEIIGYLIYGLKSLEEVRNDYQNLVLPNNADSMYFIEIISLNVLPKYSGNNLGKTLITTLLYNSTIYENKDKAIVFSCHHYRLATWYKSTFNSLGKEIQAVEVPNSSNGDAYDGVFEMYVEV